MGPDERASFQAHLTTEYRRAALGVIAKSIALAHEANPKKWGVRIDQGVFMLKVGFHEVLMIGPRRRPCHLIVDRTLVPRELRANPELWFSGDKDYQLNPRKPGYYASNPGSEACEFDFPELDWAYAALSEAHAAIIRRAARLRTHPSTIRLHCPEAVAFVAFETGLPLRQPEYANGAPLPSAGPAQPPAAGRDGGRPPSARRTSSSDAAEGVSPHATAAFRLPEEDIYVEGAMTTVAVNRDERDPRARAQCIAHHGAACAVCGFDFGKTYGDLAEGYIHVHHLRPLASEKGARAVDPVADLRPVCPNCHAVLHRRTPPIEIDTLREILLQKAARRGPAA